jgi:hypothetical protein
LVASGLDSEPCERMIWPRMAVSMKLLKARLAW